MSYAVSGLYTTYGPTDPDPPSKVYGGDSTGDVRDGFRSLVNR